jgi:hypothetical protein
LFIDKNCEFEDRNPHWQNIRDTRLALKARDRWIDNNHDAIWEWYKSDDPQKHKWLPWYQP